ncbi:MAG TPA: hypothetical protein DEA90_12215 [Opitutae bacterium]|nr:hypothetical protein [Puniceicoccaceae bacterium]HBR94917.1 hypothetical protein [Opitutae bacterium]
MKFLPILLLFHYTISAQAQVRNPLQNTKTTEQAKVSTMSTNDHEALNALPKDVSKFKAIGFVSYSDFGAIGDGVTDAIDAIAATHEFANQHSLPVKAGENATYYISGKERPVVIQTDTDFGTAAFVIDDRNVENYRSEVFLVDASQPSIELPGISSLRKNQKKIDVSLPQSCLITVTNSETKHYVRSGANQTNGAPQTDIFIVDANGNVNQDTPIIWDFDHITEISALPIDEKTLNITGGRFTTIANNAESKYTYYARGITIKRSNVCLDGLEHYVRDEGDQGAPYRAFIGVNDSYNVTIQNTTLTGRKTYETIGAAGSPVSMGSYDFYALRAVNVSLVNCEQTNDINDPTYWGIMASSYSKNITYDHCTLSRFDAHKGVANASILNSTLGHMGINAIGCGVLTVENTTIHARKLINLRSDYGSTWEGELIIRNCVFAPKKGSAQGTELIGGQNSGQHDFGYTCYMPERIRIETLHIDDSKDPKKAPGPALFTDFNPEMTDESYRQEFPYILTKEVTISNVTTASGKALRISNNPFMFKDVVIHN